MKRVVTAICCVLLLAWAGVVLATYNGIQSDEVYARSYGNKTHAAFTNALALIGSNIARTVVIDGGTWTITNSVHVSSNIALKITHDSSINVATTMVLNLPGVNIVAPANRLIFPGTGIATGPIGNAYAMANWQGARSFYLAPLNTNLLSITTYTNDLAGLSNGIVRFATNSDVAVSNSLTLYTREQIAASNSLLTNLAATTYLASNNPVNVENISYTNYPFIGTRIGITSADGQNSYPAFTNLGFVKLTNWTVNSDYYNFWNAASQQFKPTIRGTWAMHASITFSSWDAGNPNPYCELVWARNANSNEYPSGDTFMATNSLFVDDASGPAGELTRCTASGSLSFEVSNIDDKYELFFSIDRETCKVNSASVWYEYLGITNLAK